MIKKYLSKEFRKIFLKHFSITLGLMLVVLVGLLHYITDTFTITDGVIISLLFAIFDGVSSTERELKLGDVNQLTVDNYWKLKKELNNKVTKKSRKKK